jgi:hypothetical protein
MRVDAADVRRRFAAGFGHQLGLGALLAILVSCASNASHADPGRALSAKTPGAAPPPAAGAAAAPEKKAEVRKKDEKLYSFSMDKKPWGSVFSWLADRTGRPVIAPNYPAGTFTFIAPEGKKYTLPEVIDIINDGLVGNVATQKYYMINRDNKGFLVVPADDKVDPVLLPRITPDELEDRGRTELVQMVLRLKVLDVEQQALEAKRQLGPFGEVIPLTASNSLLVSDIVGNLRRLKKTIDAQEKEAGPS